mmetsp:Transcript_22453/g.52361  ORF Transcript_22453/g.52361 Transcript_22453/m.52361 type:complete len:203 (-) Transcript_22453:800-1408(-)
MYSRRLTSRDLRMSSVRFRIPYSALISPRAPVIFLYCICLLRRSAANFLNSSPLRTLVPPLALDASCFSLSSPSNSCFSSLSICNLSIKSCFLRATTEACCRNIVSLSSSGLVIRSCLSTSAEISFCSSLISVWISASLWSETGGWSSTSWMWWIRVCFCAMSCGSFSSTRTRVTSVSSSSRCSNALADSSLDAACVSFSRL